MAERLAEFKVETNGDIETTSVVLGNLSNASKFNNRNVVVVSILGPSRNGKSAFINCILSFLHNKNIHVFRSQSSKLSNFNDVTTGMNYYIQPLQGDKDYVFIDVQGLGGVYSEQDPVVSMFCYYISDLIIVNWSKQIDSSTLEILTPISSLAAKLRANIQKRPYIMFRVIDAVDGYDDELAKKNFEVMMKSRKDKINGVRENIKGLFTIPDKPIVWTTSPPPTILSKFDNGDFTDALNKRDEYNFLCACTGVLNTLKNVTGVKNIFDVITRYANDINNKKDKINPVIFDTSSRINKEDIETWIHGTTIEEDGEEKKSSQIPEDLKQALIISSASPDMYALCETRRKAINEVYTKYNERFDKAPPGTKAKGLKIIEEMLEKHYNNAYNACKGYAYSYLYNIRVDNQDIFRYTFISSQYDINSKKSDIYFDNLCTLVNSSNLANYWKEELIKEIKKDATTVHKDLKQYYGDFNKTVKIKHVEMHTNALVFIKNIKTYIDEYYEAININYDSIEKIVTDKFKDTHKIIKKSETKSDIYTWFKNLKNIIRYSDDDDDDNYNFPVESKSYTLNITNTEYVFKEGNINTIMISKEIAKTVKTLLKDLRSGISEYKDEFCKRRLNNLQSLVDKYVNKELKLEHPINTDTIAIKLNDIHANLSEYKLIKIPIVKTTYDYRHSTRYCDSLLCMIEEYPKYIFKLYTKEEYEGLIHENVRKYLDKYNNADGKTDYNKYVILSNVYLSKAYDILLDSLVLD